MGTKQGQGEMGLECTGVQSGARLRLRSSRWIGGTAWELGRVEA